MSYLVFGKQDTANRLPSCWFEKGYQQRGVSHFAANLEYLVALKEELTTKVVLEALQTVVSEMMLLHEKQEADDEVCVGVCCSSYFPTTVFASAKIVDAVLPPFAE